MNVEIRTLTGPNQGSSEVIEAIHLSIGETDDCDVQFDASQIPEAAGRRVELQRTENGWIVTNVGSGEIRVNQDFVDQPRQIKPGDVIRISENGPDYSFGLVRPGVIVTGDAQDTSTRQEANGVAAGAATATSGLAGRHPAVVVGLAAVVLVVLVGLLFNWTGRPASPPESPPESPTKPEVAMEITPVATQKIPERAEWQLDVPLRLTNLDRSDVKWKFAGAVPAGMQIDSASGKIHWTPSESQGPDTYQVTVVASHANIPEVSAKLELEVTEANRPPVVEPIPTVVLSGENDYTLDYQVRASDPDQPRATLHYELSPSAPEGMTVDPAQGQIRWKPSQQQLGESYAVMLTVSEPENPSGVTSVAFLVRSVVVKPSQGVKDAMYVVTLTAPGAPQQYPIANAVAISPDNLMTTAVAAHEIEQKKQQGWQVKVVPASGGAAELVQDILIHKSNRELADDPAAQIYVDLAILKVQDRPDRVVAELAGEAELEKLIPGSPLRCLIIKHKGEPLTSFDNTTPVFHDVRLHSRSQLIPDRPSPAMFHLQAELPKHSHGGAVFNKENQLLAIVAETASFPQESDMAPLNGRIHYAPSLFLISSWMDQQGDLQQEWERPLAKPDQEP